MLDEVTTRLVMRKGYRLSDVPTPLGKPLGECTKEDLEGLAVRSKRIADIAERLAGGQQATTKERKLVQEELDYQAKTISWARDLPRRKTSP